MIYILDTNVLVNLAFRKFIELTPQEEKLVEIIKDLEPRERWVTDFVLTEFSLVSQKIIPTRYGFVNNRPFLSAYYEQVSNFFTKFATMFTTYVPDPMEVEEALSEYVNYWKESKSERALSFVDLFLILIAKKNSIGLLTADKKMLSYIKTKMVK